MNKYLFITLTLITFLQSNQPAKADLGLTASFICSVLGIGYFVATPFFDADDKIDGADEEGGDAFGDDLSRAKIEDFKSNLGKRWVK